MSRPEALESNSGGQLSEYFWSRPLDRGYYERLRLSHAKNSQPLSRSTVAKDTGSAFDVSAGELIGVELIEGPQIVNLFAFNPHDPDERVWPQNTSTVEGAWMRRYSRLWGSMPRFRPMLTVVEDTVVTLPTVGMVAGKHHFLFGGSGTPADWAMGGGPPNVKTTWERFGAVMEERGLSPYLVRDNVCLFQKMAVDPRSQLLFLLPSDAVAGDRIVFFVEMDLVVVLALSPYVDGSKPPNELDGAVRKVDFLTFGNVAEPLGWPYEGIAYPDLSLYLDASGVRSTAAEPTRGLEAPNQECVP